MYKSHRFIITAVLLGAYLLSACAGATPPQVGSSQDVQNVSGSQSTEVVFTGTVDSMDGTQWVISGQQVNVEGSSLDANIQVGDIVKVEATVSQDGTVIAVKVESSGPDDTNANDNSANDNSGNANDDNANSNVNSNDNTNSTNSNGNDNSNSNANSNDAAGPEQEVSGVVQAIGSGTITIDGVTYNLADFTEFKSVVAVGDQVKLHVIVNADGTFTIREIEKISGTGIGDDDGNSNSNDNSSNSNSNDDHGGNSNGSDDNSNSNSNDDHGGSNDNGGNSNSNGGG